MKINSSTLLGHPDFRPRRLRRTQALRSLVAETTLSVNDLIAPIFVSEDGTTRFPIPSLPGISRVPLQELDEELKELHALGIKAVLLFPVVDPTCKDPSGKEAYNPNGLIQRAVARAKKSQPEIIVMADVALDPFTSHGHDGIVSADGEVLNDETVHALTLMSVSLAESGVDLVAPSDMMDGRILSIRRALDAKGYTGTGILAYSAKYASAFYGPFREAISSGARGLDKKTYQLSPANISEALTEARLDDEEGADMLMVKPALCYLDVVAKVKAITRLPIVAYHVSGEYAMLKAAVQNNWLDEKPVVEETMLSMKRAGASLIVTYYAKWAATHLFKK